MRVYIDDEQMTTNEIEKFIENTDLDNDSMVSINDIQQMLLGEKYIYFLIFRTEENKIVF